MRNAVKILIVDDDKASANMISEIVKRMGFKPVVTTKQADALNVVRLQTVHAAVLDVLLPKVSGVDLALEFRKTKFADNPIVFVSGVFKDKGFAAETMKKTGAVDFLFKPFNADDLMAALNKSLHSLLSAEKWSVQSLLSRKLNSERERAKAIERLEQIQGLDFPFVLSILMEVGSSGHLNIVNDIGEIFGVSLVKGAITAVDSTESQSAGVLALISGGYLSQEDWDNFQKSGARKFSLEKLVQEGYVSPHAISQARREQIINDFRSICTARALHVNFVPQDDGEELPKHAVKLHDMMGLLESALDEFFPEAYLTSFYESVREAPIRVARDPEQVQSVWEANAFKNLTTLKDAVENGGTLEQALLASPGSSAKTYQCLHYLVLNRTIIFDDLNRAKNLTTMLERYKKLYGELKTKTPDKIFEYFGAKANSAPTVIQTIFNEFSKSNNPEQLGRDATPELVDLCKKCFDLVNEAREVLMDEEKKVLLMEQIRNRHAEDQKRAQQLMNDGLETLRKGQAAEALEKLKEAERLQPSTRLFFITTWAEVKAGASKDKPRLVELMKQLDGVLADDRKTAFYYMACGMVKKGLGDGVGAQAMFEKTLQMDSQFSDARRELRSLQGPQAAGKDKKLDIFTGDITEIVSSIFRRKAD